MTRTFVSLLLPEPGGHVLRRIDSWSCYAFIPAWPCTAVFLYVGLCCARGEMSRIRGGGGYRIIWIFWITLAMLGGVPVPTAWRVLGLRMEERPPAMEVSCEYIE
jgi:hypothetical protein